MSKDSPFPPMEISSGGVTLCRGCRPSGVCKLGNTRTDVDVASQTITSMAQCPPGWEGGPGVAHGGWIACVFDEVLGTLRSRLDFPCVTAALLVTCLVPAPISRTVVVTARVASPGGPRWTIDGAMRLADGGRDLARASV